MGGGWGGDSYPYIHFYIPKNNRSQKNNAEHEYDTPSNNGSSCATVHVLGFHIVVCFFGYQVFEGILRVSDLYLQLIEAGEINYLSWKEKFECSKDECRRKELLNNINENCARMEKKLKQWKKIIDGKRQTCYSLNHFTMKQILNLRKELGNASTGNVAVDELPLQTYVLLETVNKSINPLLLAEVLRTIPGNSIRLTDNGYKDGQKYFANEMQDENITAENAKKEIDEIQPSGRRRVNSIETFISAKEALENESMEINTEDYLLAALHDCGRCATKDELVAWVISHENDDEETVMTSCEEARRNPVLSDLVQEVFGLPSQTVIDKEESTHER